jgi:membrane-associated phospholipid phosphatase
VSTGNNPYAPLMQSLSNLSEGSIKNGGSHLYATFNQDGLWEGAITGEWGPFGGISAMPSVHLSMATLFVWLAFEVRKWLGWVFVGYLALIQIGSVILGWHYAVDGYLGILLASMIWLCVRRFVYRG